MQNSVSQRRIKNEKSFLTKKELAQFLGLSIYTVDAWVSERREIPFVKMGRRVMFDLKDVLAWVESNKMQPRSITGPEL